MTKQFEEIGKKIAAGEAGQYEAAILWQELERVNTGEPPQPRCPKCGSNTLSKGYVRPEGEQMRLTTACCSCQWQTDIYGKPQFDLADFAQFFGPSAPQSLTIEQLYEAAKVVNSGDVRKDLYALEGLALHMHRDTGEMKYLTEALNCRVMLKDFDSNFPDPLQPSAPSGSAGQEPRCGVPIGFSENIMVHCDKPKGHDGGYHEPEGRVGQEPQPPASPVAKNSCNRHADCAKANEEWLKRNPGKTFVPFSFHCHSEDCEDCFGQ